MDRVLSGALTEGPETSGGWVTGWSKGTGDARFRPGTHVYVAQRAAQDTVFSAAAPVMGPSVQINLIQSLFDAPGLGCRGSSAT
jgi:hypothetical protein